jgi:iron complex outermembrane recepter protein
MFSKKLLSGAAITALSFSFAGVAHAQSTASQIQDDAEVIVVTGARAGAEGVMVNENAPRARASITDEYIETQASGQTILESINLIPGVNFTSTDAFGVSGGAINMRGFDGARISLTVDGIPLNDTGNYAVYSNQQMDPELIQRANVNLGTTEVDSPTAAATGGTVNYITRVPDEEFGVMASYARGTENFSRAFGMIETGAIGPLATRFFAAGSFAEYDQFVGPGELQRWQINGGFYQPIGSNGDFVRLSAHYNENRNNFYYRFTRAQYEAGFRENLDSCTPLAGGAGVQNSANDGCTGSNFRNYYNHSINPSNTGNIRGQSLFTLSDALTLTVDPTFQYVRANGGGTEVVSEGAWRLIGGTPLGGTDLNNDGDFVDAGEAAPLGLDLNNDGDTVDSVRLYSPSNTNTYRYGVTSSLIWDINENHSVRFGYTYDFGAHEQTGEYGFLRGNGDPEDVFGGRNGFGQSVITGSGDVFQKRDRDSEAILNQFSVEWRGAFMDDMMTVVLGLRAPEFERNLDQHCYSRKGQSSSTQYCTDEAADTPGMGDANAGQLTGGFVWFDVDSDGVIDYSATSGSSEVFAPPFRATVTYDDILPNFGITFRPADGHQIFFSYAEGLSAPRTDDLYSGITVAQLGDPQPETTNAYDLGYRYSGGDLLLSATAWFNQFDNRIERAPDPDDPSLFVSRNVGTVELWGAEAAAGWNATEDFFLYAAASWTDSEVQSTGNGVVDTPDWTFTARGEYELGAFTIGAQASYVGERWANDNNTEVADSYTTVDLDARYSFGEFLGAEQTYLQLNVINLLDEEYFGQLSPQAGSSAGQYNLGAPQTVMVTLRTEF